MAPMFPLVVDRVRRRRTPGDAAGRTPRLGRGRRPGPHRGAGHRGAASRRRRCLAGQLGQLRGAGRAGPRAVAPAHRCRSRTTSRGEPSPATPRLVPHDPSWPDQARRIVGRLNTACGQRALRIDHIGSTAVPGWTPRTSSTFRSRSHRWTAADELAEALRAAGYPRIAQSPPTCAKPDARSTVAEFDHTDDPSLVAQATSRVGRSRPADECPSCASTAGPISSSRCCSSTG